MNGKLVTPHCNNSTSKTFHGDQWVTVEVEVHGNKLIRHRVNGEKVFEYEQPQLDERRRRQEADQGRQPDARRRLDLAAGREPPGASSARSRSRFSRNEPGRALPEKTVEILTGFASDQIRPPSVAAPASSARTVQVLSRCLKRG